MLHHVELNVSNLKKSIVVWDWLLLQLGYTVYQQWDQGKSYRYEATYIVLVQTDEKHLASPYHRKHTGLNHLAFHVPSFTQIEQIRSELVNYGLTELYGERFPYAGGPNHLALYFEDPDRIKIELVATL